jgi:hypothetical protein
MKTKTGVERCCCGSIVLPRCCDGFTRPPRLFATVTVHKTWGWFRNPWSGGSGPWVRVELPEGFGCGICSDAVGNPLPLFDVELTLAPSGFPPPNEPISYSAGNTVPVPDLFCNMFDLGFGCSPPSGPFSYSGAAVWGVFAGQGIFADRGWYSETNAWTTPPPHCAVDGFVFSVPPNNGETLSCDPFHFKVKMMGDFGASAFAVHRNGCNDSTTISTVHGDFRVVSSTGGVFHKPTDLSTEINYTFSEFVDCAGLYHELLMELVE